MRKHFRRKEFYLRNGFQQTKVSYTWRQEDYEILCWGGSLTENEFEAFWDCVYTDSDALQEY